MTITALTNAFKALGTIEHIAITDSTVDIVVTNIRNNPAFINILNNIVLSEIDTEVYKYVRDFNIVDSRVKISYSKLNGHENDMVQV